MTTWKKATASNPNGNCVEVSSGCPALRGPGACGMVHVRDTKDNGSGPVLNVTPAEWEAFLDGVRKGEFDI